jgi:uncharacterized protein (DUF885 family)
VEPTPDPSASAPSGALGRAIRPDGLPEPASPFEAAVVELLVELFDAYPTWGTSAGYHAVDDRWPDLSEAGREARLAMLRRHAARFESVDPLSLDDEERIDRDIVLEQIEGVVFGDEVLREEAWDPLSVVSIVGSGLFSVLSREFAPWPRRGASLVARIEALPRFLEGALAGFTGLPGRPVSLLHLETAVTQSSGIDDLLDSAVAEARDRAANGEAADLVPPMEAAAGRAREAVEAFRRGLDTDVRPRATGEGRLGPELFARKLRLTLGSDLAPGELRERAWADFRAVRAEMVRLARASWPTWVPTEPLPDVQPGDEAGEGRLVRRALDAIAEEHQQPDSLVPFCEAEMARIEAFCRDRGVIELPREPLAITWTPVFMRAYARAFLDSPGPLDRGLHSWFWITPPDESLGPEAVASYLREENDRMLRLLSIHEGIPGHYLQLAASNRCGSLVRTVFVNGMFAEGWAVYVTQVMMDLGYGADDPGLMLVHWKMYLRAVVNALLDVETHVGGLAEEEALRLMVEGAFQEADEARGKWLRARLTSTQLSTYYVGSLEMWDLEVAARRRAAVAAGAAAETVPAQHIAGGLGETPGFDRRAHMEAVIAHGTPPIKWCRRILLGPDA